MRARMQVRVWDVELGKCLICFNFGRPIASLAFHAAGTFLAVASGHKVSHLPLQCSLLRERHYRLCVFAAAGQGLSFASVRRHPASLRCSLG